MVGAPPPRHVPVTYGARRASHRQLEDTRDGEQERVGAGDGQRRTGRRQRRTVRRQRRTGRRQARQQSWTTRAENTVNAGSRGARSILVALPPPTPNLPQSPNLPAPPPPPRPSATAVAYSETWVTICATLWLVRAATLLNILCGLCAKCTICSRPRWSNCESTGPL